MSEAIVKTGPAVIRGQHVIRSYDTPCDFCLDGIAETYTSFGEERYDHCKACAAKVSTLTMAFTPKLSERALLALRTDVWAQRADVLVNPVLPAAPAP